MSTLLLQADSRAIPLADKSVHCIVTSPPYYGLRDYGTAQWAGGDLECDHKVRRFETPCSEKQRSNNGSGDVMARQVCPKCGARRVDAQIGLEASPAAYVASIVAVARECWRVLRDDGTLWLNLGDSYSAGGGKQVVQTKNASHGLDGMRQKTLGMRSKQLLGVPWRVAFALQDDGWVLRSDIIWNKPNTMPESVQDRCTRSHEYVFMFAKSERYYFDQDAIREPHQPQSIERAKYEFTAMQGVRDEPNGRGNTGNKEQALHPAGRNKRDVWTIPSEPLRAAHYAAFPQKLVEPMILAATSAFGCCSRCGSPYVRIIQRTDTPDASAKGSRFDQGKTGHNGNGRVQAGDRFVTQTCGWRPTCACNAGVIPATVLDPFCGSGTTLRVAVKHGRHGIGLDLSAAYLTEIAVERLDAVQLVMGEVQP